MTPYIIRRLIIAVPLLLAISFVAFMFIHLAPGNYFDTLRMSPQISEETIKKYESQYHLDKPPLIQYAFWLKNLLRLDLGYSFVLMSPVTDVIKKRLFNTFILSLAAMLFTWFIAIPLGIFCAVRQNSFSDRFFSALSFVGLSIPNFFFALLLLYLASLTGILPLGGMRSANYEGLSQLGRFWDLLKHLLIPTIVIGTSSLAGLQRIMRGNMLEVLRAQYITTARAKGLPERRVIYIHALRNAVNPMITIFGYSLSGLLSGAALTEIITGWPGLGSVMLQAVRSQDLFLVMGSMLMGGVMLIGANLVADILLAWSDPRIQYK
ncbi:MAG: ABC transporter permease [Candidatus Omnitrophica bacterium]|nr:ABC transporter permease [Candidatus Omnitrophota bacterium]MBU3934168.1 ABC transporter permease [Candidatus Omnitrophota bacterium]MBU4141011.1 ABC transporter permease [Candidatus Omnitrophota bacterium]